MSFKCDDCNTAQEDNTKPNRVVVETRNVTYRTDDGQTPSGTEIVRETNLCADCTTNPF